TTAPRVKIFSRSRGAHGNNRMRYVVACGLASPPDDPLSRERREGEVRMRILVTGGAGDIGRHAAKLFRERGHEVWVIDSLAMGHRAAVPADRLVVADLNDVHRLDQLLVEQRIDAVVHFAAYAFVGESVQMPAKYWQNNLVNTVNLLE